MDSNFVHARFCFSIVAGVVVLASVPLQVQAQAVSLDPAKLPRVGGAPKDYNAADYARDIAVFKPWLKENSPGTVFLGPGSVGEGPFAIAMAGMLHTEDLLKATGPVFDVFSYHLYAAASQR